MQDVSCDQVSDSFCVLLAGVGAQASVSAETLQQLQVVLHLLSPQGSPALEARTVAVKAGRWYARGLTGAADGAAAGAGGTVEMRRFRLSVHPAHSISVLALQTLAFMGDQSSCWPPSCAGIRLLACLLPAPWPVRSLTARFFCPAPLVSSRHA